MSTPGITARFHAWAEAHPRRTPAVLVAVAILLASPTLLVGWYTDDYAQLCGLRGVPGALVEPPFDLYTFATPDARTWATIEGGPLPWWTDRALSIRFFRPIPSALLTVEHALSGGSPIVSHLGSLAWLAALVLVAYAFFRRVAPSAAPLAGLLVAVDDAHWMSAGWLAARHSIVAAAFVVLAILAHVRAREDGWARGRAASIGALVLALASSEVAIGALGYLLAYELGSGRRPADALRACAPAIATVLAYVVVYEATGWGATPSAAYVDPFRDPLAYGLGAGPRLGALSLAALASVPSDLWMALPAARPVLAILGAGAALALAVFARSVSPTLPPDERRTATWLLAGALLSLAPLAGAQIGDRLLVTPGIGLAGVIAIWLRHVGGRGGARVLAAVHLGVAPLMMVLMSVNLVAIAGAAREAAFDPALPHGESAAEHDVIVIAAPDPAASIFLGIARAAEPGFATRSFHVLSMAPGRHVVTRTGTRSLRVEADEGMLRTPIERILRRSEHPVRVGDVVELRGATVRVVAADAEGPTAIEVELERTPGDPRLSIVTWRDGRLRPIDLPAAGASVALEPTPGPQGI